MTLRYRFQVEDLILQRWDTERDNALYGLPLVLHLDMIFSLRQLVVISDEDSLRRESGVNPAPKDQEVLSGIGEIDLNLSTREIVNGCNFITFIKV